ncbi:Unknown protein sequence [Pseudomonas amygdali pv. morsprunorum]|nr:Unknown protein sequence [Pseudomonas amygdali pv. morsprunorum]
MDSRFRDWRRLILTAGGQHWHIHLNRVSPRRLSPRISNASSYT